MKRIILYLFFSVLMFSQTSSQPAFDSVLHKSYFKRIDSLKKIIDRITKLKDDSAGAFQQIEKFRQFAIKHGDKEIEMEADMIPAYYFSRNRPDNRALVISTLQNVINKAEAKGMMIIQARAMVMLSDYYFKTVGNYVLAFEEYFKLEKLIEQISYDAFPDKLTIMNNIGEAYFYFSDYPQSIHYLRKAIQFQAIPYNRRWYNLALNTLGLCYQLTGNLDSSDYYFNRLLDKKDPMHLPVWETITMGNLGYNLYLRGKYDQAIPLFEADVAEAEKKQDWGLASGSLIPWADILFKQKKYAESDKKMFLAKDYVIRSGQYKRYATLYPLLSKWYALKDQLSLSAQYLDSTIYVKDSLARKFRTLQLLRSEQKAELLQHRSEMATIDSEKKIKTLQRDILIAFIILLILIIIYVFKGQQRKHKQEKRILDMELANNKKELAAAAMQLGDFSNSIAEKNKLIETLEQQFGENSNNAALEQIRQVTILTDEEWDKFRSLFTKVHGGYLQRLDKKLPDLTPAETRFMALAKLGFSNKEMAAMQGVSTNNIRNIWHRLRKKIGISEEASYKDLSDTI